MNNLAQITKSGLFFSSGLSGSGSRLFLFVAVLCLSFKVAQAKEFSTGSLMLLPSDITDSDNSFDSVFGKGELWTDKWGVSASLMQNNKEQIFGLPSDSEFFNLDIKRRFGQSNKSNIELGFGWQEFSIDSYLDASGPRLSLNGHLNLRPSIKLYGLSSYFPELDDSISNNDISAYELEAGVMYKPLPSMSLKAGYRHFSLDLDDPHIESLGSSSGFLLGTGWSW